MTLYVPAAEAEILSRALCALVRPAAVRQADDTPYLFPWVEALDNSVWLKVETEYEIRVHEQADLGGIAEVLQPWIDEGFLAADTNEQLGALVESLRGQKLVVYDAFPQFFKDRALERKDMIEAGLLASPTL